MVKVHIKGMISRSPDSASLHAYKCAKFINLSGFSLIHKNPLIPDLGFLLQKLPVSWPLLLPLSNTLTLRSTPSGLS